MWACCVGTLCLPMRLQVRGEEGLCLQRDVVRCVHADRSYSPYCDMAKSLAGDDMLCFRFSTMYVLGQCWHCCKEKV